MFASQEYEIRILAPFGMRCQADNNCCPNRGQHGLFVSDDHGRTIKSFVDICDEHLLHEVTKTLFHGVPEAAVPSSRFEGETYPDHSAAYSTVEVIPMSEVPEIIGIPQADGFSEPGIERQSFELTEPPATDWTATAAKALALTFDNEEKLF